MATMEEYLDSLEPYNGNAEDPDDPQGSVLPFINKATDVKRQAIRAAIDTGKQAYQDATDWATDPRNSFPQPWNIPYERGAQAARDYEVQREYNNYKNPNAVEDYARDNPDFREGYRQLQDYYRKGGDVEEVLNHQLETEPFLRKQIALQEANEYLPSEASRPRDEEAMQRDEANPYKQQKRLRQANEYLPSEQTRVADNTGGLFTKSPWEAMDERNRAEAGRNLPSEVDRSASTERAWNIVEGRAGKTSGTSSQSEKGRSWDFTRTSPGASEFGTTTLTPAQSDQDSRWGIKADPKDMAGFLFGPSVNEKPKAIPDIAPSQPAVQMTPQMQAQVQVMSHIMSTQNPQLIPGNPLFNMFAFADYINALRMRNTMDYYQRVGKSAGGFGYQSGSGGTSAQPSVLPPEVQAERQNDLGKAKKLGLQQGKDRYGNLVFYDPKTKRMFKSIAEYKQFISTNSPSAAAQRDYSEDALPSA